MRRRILTYPVLGLTFVAFACGDDRNDAFDAIAIDTLDSGVIRVHNPATGAWGDEPEWRLVEQVRIGAVEGGGPDVFGQVRGLAVNSSGNVHVLDYQANEVRVFASDGTHLRTLAGEGSGPGELRMPFALGIDDSDRVWTADMGNNRYTVWDSAGTLVDTRPRPFLTWPYIAAPGFDGERIIENVSIGDSPETRSSAFARLSLDDTAAADTFAIPPSPLPNLVYQVSREGRMLMGTVVPFRPGYHTKLAGDGSYWVGASDSYRLHRLTYDGDTVRTVERDYSPVPVSRAERDSALNTDIMNQLRQAGGEVDAALVPANKPAYQSLVVDDDGYLWVRATNAHGEAGTRFDIFDPVGRYLGQVASPLAIGTSYPPPVIADGMMWALIRDELDVSYIVGLRIEGR